MTDISLSSSWSTEGFLHSTSPEPLFLTLPFTAGDPFDVYVRVTGLSRPSFFLESGQGFPSLSRYSFIGRNPYQTFTAKGKRYQIDDGTQTVEGEGDPISVFSSLLSLPRYERPPDFPLFVGGAVGFVSYDMVRQFEVLPEIAEDSLSVPDMLFMFVDVFVVIDHAAQVLHLVFAPDPRRWLGESRDELYREGRERLLELQAHVLGTSEPFEPHIQKSVRPRIDSEQSQSDYMHRVQACQEFIADGDIYQANLSHRFRLAFPTGCFSDHGVQGAYWYEKVRKVNPSPFSALMITDEFTVVSNSPERLVRLAGQRADIRPIAGTRARGKTIAEDRKLVEELLASAKERAEHLMLVDLARNDLGKVCRYGTIRADQFMTVERYSHVSHLVSNISGLVDDGISACDLLRATFPGGTITGVPKIHCMEIIEQLEPVRRGLYTGSLGYVSWSGDMDMNILIRTLLVTAERGYLQVGAGIVADSSPSHEYDETIQKAQAFFQAIL